MKRDRELLTQKIIDHVLENEQELINKVMGKGEIQGHHDVKELRDIFTHFLHRFHDRLKTAQLDDNSPQTFLTNNTTFSSLENRVSVIALIEGLYEISKSIWTMFQAEAREQFGLSSDELLHVHDLLNKEIKIAIKEILNKHVDSTKEREAQFNEKLNELSVPIINLTSKIAVCPLIGTIDEKRGQLLMVQTLNVCKERKLSKLIFDMSGVPDIDDIVASYINSVIQSLSLIGVHITLTGVRSNIAMTVVQQGINFQHVHIAPNVPQALESYGLKLEETKIRGSNL
ncbi:STAS domain-containing protein [Salipaludibacillus neizhouensis]|nr:STAS domain-containing protein [Salipaludibacillus neizhouensis]